MIWLLIEVPEAYTANQNLVWSKVTFGFTLGASNFLNRQEVTGLHWISAVKYKKVSCILLIFYETD